MGKNFSSHYLALCLYQLMPKNTCLCDSEARLLYVRVHKILKVSLPTYRLTPATPSN
jgi:hypothetical protein